MKNYKLSKVQFVVINIIFYLLILLLHITYLRSTSEISFGILTSMFLSFFLLHISLGFYSNSSVIKDADMDIDKLNLAEFIRYLYFYLPILFLALLTLFLLNNNNFLIPALNITAFFSLLTTLSIISIKLSSKFSIFLSFNRLFTRLVIIFILLRITILPIFGVAYDKKLIYDLFPNLVHLISDWKFSVIFVNACLMTICLLIRNTSQKNLTSSKESPI